MATPGTERVEAATNIPTRQSQRKGGRDLKPTTPPRILRYEPRRRPFSNHPHLHPIFVFPTPDSHRPLSPFVVSPHLFTFERDTACTTAGTVIPSPSRRPSLDPTVSRDLPRARTLTARRGAADDSSLDLSPSSRQSSPLQTSSTLRPRPVSVFALPAFPSSSYPFRITTAVVANLAQICPDHVAAVRAAEG